jgi:predicted 3-demethylubiquinone-9 3-methyltransferase (glyoxalase superfamily)
MSGLTFGKDQEKIMIKETAMKKITPFLWFDDQAEEAMNFYISIFKNSRILSVSPGPNGKAFTVSFELDGQEFTALNGGPLFKFTEATSFFVNCETQVEVDDLWEKLSAGGEKGQCGWLKDKYGLSWQIVPVALGRLLGDPDPTKSQRVMQAMLKMQKIDISGLQQAYDQG